MLTITDISWIQEQIQKTGKVAPVDADKLMGRLVGVLNAKLKAKLADEAGLTQILEQAKERERIALGKALDRELAREKKKLQEAFGSKAQELEAKTSDRIRQAEYAQSVVSALGTVLEFVFRTEKQLFNE